VEANVEVDFTALEAMEAVRNEIIQRGAVFALARVKQDLLARLQAFGLAGKIGTERLYPTLPTAVEAYQAWARHNGPQPGREGAPDSLVGGLRLVAWLRGPTLLAGQPVLPGIGGLQLLQNRNDQAA